MQNQQQHLAEQSWNQSILSVEVQVPEARLWQYDAPAIVLGRSQHALLTADPALSRAGIDIVLRHAGGGAVLVGPWMLSASVVLPASHRLVTPSTAKSYQWIGDLYASVLAAAGVETHVLTPEEAHAWKLENRASPVEWACFGGLSPGELVVDGRKIVGFAQVRKRNGILLVAGILLTDPDWPMLCRAMGKPAEDAAALTRCTVSCAALLGRELPVEKLANSLASALDEAIHAA